MEVELVFVDLFEMLLDVVELLQSEAEVPLSQMRPPALNLEPHALHIMHVQPAVPAIGHGVPREEGHSLFSLLHLIDPQLVAGGDCVQVPIREIELSGLVIEGRGAEQVACAFVDFGLEDIEVYYRRGVLDGLVQPSEGMI